MNFNIHPVKYAILVLFSYPGKHIKTVIASISNLDLKEKKRNITKKKKNIYILRNRLRENNVFLLKSSFLYTESF